MLILFGLISIFVLGKKDEQKAARCTKENRAVVTKVKTKGNAEDRNLEYVTDLEYTVEGQVYTLRYTLNMDMGVGKKLKMKYNPDDASECYIVGIDTGGGGSRVIGVLAIGAGLAIIAISGGVTSTRTYGD